MWSSVSTVTVYKSQLLIKLIEFMASLKWDRNFQFPTNQIQTNAVIANKYSATNPLDKLLP